MNTIPTDPDRASRYELFEEFMASRIAPGVTQASASVAVPQPEIGQHPNADAGAAKERIARNLGHALVVADLSAKEAVHPKTGHRLPGPFGPLVLGLIQSTAGRLEATRPRLKIGAVGAAALVVVTATLALTLGSAAPTPRTGHATGLTGNAQILRQARGDLATVKLASLPAATAPPAPAPPSLAGAPPLRPHEVFGFAPYWTLAQSAGFNVSGISTLAYFSIGVNGDGSLAESGPGWNGYQSQDLTNLITRAHGAGDRVVLTVNCFDQRALDQLTSSATAPSVLSEALLGAVQAKNLDGVNLDFEGQGSADQAGLTKLVTQVSSALHAANPHYQVTMDTYASSAGDPSGFYNIQALAPVVDGFFVMAYQLNLQSPPAAVSPLTSTMFSDKDTIDQYAAAAPPAKVILGLPYFGVDWPTTDGTLTAQATGPSTTLSIGQITASGHPIYWDATTDTAWTSYQVGSQWHESFFEDPTSLYDAAQLSGASNLGGVGIWALGMDGNDPALLSALLGFAPATKGASLGPAPTTTTTAAAPSTTTTTSRGSTSSSTTTTVPSSTTTTTTGPGTTTTTTSPYSYTGTWQGHTEQLTMVQGAGVPTLVPGPAVGTMTEFATDDLTVACLANEPSLQVWAVSGSSNEFVVEAVKPGDCTTADFTFTTS